MRIGITSSALINPYASALIYRLAAQGNAPDCIINSAKTPTATLVRSIKRRGLIGTVQMMTHITQPTDDSPIHWLQEYLSGQMEFADVSQPLPRTCSEIGIDHLRVRGVNAPAAIAIVQEREIDVLINAGGGIFGRAILASPRLGMLNAHMGYLPTFRGMNVLEWSVWHRQPPGVTIHFVVRDIDLGDILLFREIPVEPGDRIDRLRAKSVVVSVEAMAEAITLLEEGRETRIAQRPEDGRQYFVMHPRLRAIAEQRIRMADE